MGACGTTRQTFGPTRVLLDGGHSNACGVAHSGTIHRRDAIGSLARFGARKFLRGRASILVAGDPALAERSRVAAMVNGSLSVSRHPALRYPLGISCVLRSRCIHDVSFGALAIWNFRSRGPAARSRLDVDLCNAHLPCRCSNCRGTSAVGAKSRGKRFDAIGDARNDDCGNWSAKRGGRLNMASEPLAVYPIAAAQRGHSAWPGVLRDYWELTKPEINFLIAVATAVAFCVGCGQPIGRFPWVLLTHTVFGTILVASGAATLNQVIEREFDAQMRRTARRPIAAGRIEPLHALIFGTMLSLAGSFYLALAVRPAASLLAALTLGSYLFVYTPLKRRTPMCTLVGAFPGAMPVLIGYVAATGKLNSPAWILYAVLFLWQFPHFMAIAWMYRDDYLRAGYEILPRGPNKARFMGWQSVLSSLALLCVTVSALLVQHAGALLTTGTLILSLAFLYCAAKLALVQSNAAARRLLLVSVIYLPIVFALQLLAA